MDDLPAPLGSDEPQHSGSVRRQLILGLTLLSVVGVISAMAQWPTWSETPVYAAVNVLVSLTFVAAGWTAWVRQERRPLAMALVVAGPLWSLQWLTTWDAWVLPAVGLHANLFFYNLCGIAFLVAYADHGLSRSDKWLIGFFVESTCYQLVLIAMSRPEWSGFSADVWWPYLWADKEVFDAVVVVMMLFWAVVGTWFASAAFIRLRRMRGLDRVVTLPIVFGFIAVGLVSGFSSNVQPFPTTQQNAFFFMLSLLLFAVPLGLAVSAYRSNLQRLILAERVSRRLSKQVLTGDVVRDELRYALSDSTLDIFYWSASLEQYVASDGRSVENELLRAVGFMQVMPSCSGGPLAVVTGDASLSRHRTTLTSVLHASALAIENVQLQAGLSSKLEQVRLSRSRIMEVALEERRRIERDLHDGVQQRLLALQAQIGLYHKQHDGGVIATQLEYIANELRAVLHDLRELAHGIHPSELRQVGLKPAIEEMMARLPISSTVSIDCARYSPAIEATIYFVVCEAVANVLKHSQARAVTVDLVERDGVLSLTVADDGVGGGGLVIGRGLEGLADRVRTIGGQFDVSSSDKHGTSVSASVPVEARP